MTTNLASGPMNLVREMVFVRLYMTSKDATTLVYSRGIYAGQIYRPSDNLESVLYNYRIWLYENKPDAIGTEVSTLYPIAGLYESFADYMCDDFKGTRFGQLTRETWMKLMSKSAGGLSLVDSRLVLSPDEVRLVDKFDRWSGSVSIEATDEMIRVPQTVSMLEPTVHVVRDIRRPETIVNGWEPPRDVVSLEQSEQVLALMKLSGRSLVDCRRVLMDCKWDFMLAFEAIKWS